MRHLKAGRKFGRTSAHRKALFRNLVGALIEESESVLLWLKQKKKEIETEPEQ
jgi:large subunit ribosomal protein L17